MENLKQNFETYYKNKHYRFFLFCMTWLSLVLLSNYNVGGAIVCLFPLFTILRKSLFCIVGFSIFLSLKLILDHVIQVPPEYRLYIYFQEAEFREIFSLILDVQCFILGYYLFNKYFITQVNEKILIALCIANMAIHDIVNRTLFFATYDSTQVVSLYFLYIIVAYSKKLIYIYAALVIVALMDARLGSSFTSFSVLVIYSCAILRLVNANRIILPWRLIGAGFLIFFLFSSLLAQSVNLRTEGNNGLARSTLASAALSTIQTNAGVGVPLGYPVVPYRVIKELKWDQYSPSPYDTDSGFNIYYLSFHNSFLYLAVRFGILSFIVFLTFLLVMPWKGRLGHVLFTALMMLGTSANVVLESARAGPGTAFVFGSLFGVAYVSLPTLRRRQARFKAENSVQNNKPSSSTALL